MNSQILKLILPFYISLLITTASVAQTTEKSPGISLFDKGDFAGAIVLLKKSDDLVDLNYLGYAYEKLGKEKEARNAFDRSFKNGYKEFGAEIIKRASFNLVDKLSIFLERNAQKIIVTAVSAGRTIELNGISIKDNEWLMRAYLMREIGTILASNQFVYSAREIDVDARIITRSTPGYTDQARTKNTQGSVVLLVLFDRDAKVKGSIPIRGLENGLTEQAYLAANKITFEPAQKAGKPVAMLRGVEYLFSIY